MSVKIFGTDKVNDTLLNEYNFSLMGIKKKTSVNLRGFAVPLIYSPLSGQRIRIVKEECSFLQGLDLADKGKGDSDIIKRENNERLIALKSKLGWLLSGPLTTKRPVAVSVNLASTHVLKVDIALQDETLGDKINEFWSLDSIGICDKESSIYEECIDKIEVINNGYEVNLPFKNENPILEDNYNLCLKRLKNLKKKLDSNKRLLVEYDNIKNQFHEGIIEKVTSPPLVGNTTYLPHRPVIREDKASTKVRIVYDASAKNKGPSLNESLYKGPCLTPLLFDVLLRFRAHDIALTAVQRKLTYKFLLLKVRDYLCFLWFDNIYKENPDIIKYQFCRVIFGATCSQFLLNATIKKSTCRNLSILIVNLSKRFYVIFTLTILIVELILQGMELIFTRN